MFGLASHFSCWMDEDPSMWILSAPVTVSLVASLGFLIYVVRVLVTKLNSNSCHQPPMAFRKAVRATLILFPLFGLQHILFPLRPDPGTTTEKMYQIFSAMVISCQVRNNITQRLGHTHTRPALILRLVSQGLCVSLLFCFANQEVIACVRTLLHRLLPQIFDARHLEGVNGPPPTTQIGDVVV